MTTSELLIDGRAVGPDHPPYVVAEISANHLHDLDRAKRLIDAARDSGADAVKLQTYEPETITMDASGSEFQIRSGPWAGRTLHELYGEAFTPWEWHKDLFKHARARDLTIFSSPFDPGAIQLLESLECPAYKIASFELVDTGLIHQAARTGKPLVISTGMATQEEVAEALEAASSSQVALLHAVSAYPTPPTEANLLRMTALAAIFQVPVGISDHSLGTMTAICAVAMGASVVEKHLTLSREDGGPDGAFSMEPSEFARLVVECRTAWEVRGSAAVQPGSSERDNLRFRRSLYVVRHVKKGEVLTTDNVRSIRPAGGLPPKVLGRILGKRAQKDLVPGTPLSWRHVSEE